MPERQPMVSPFFLSFPLWFWILIFLFISLLVGVGFTAYQYLQKKRALKIQPALAPKPTGQQLLEEYLRNARAAKLILQSDSQSLNDLYSKGYDCVRSFLEYKLHFKASWATSSEFIGSLKASLLGYTQPSTLAYDVESVLQQADLVRFSKDIPPETPRQNYLNTIQKIYDTVL